MSDTLVQVPAGDMKEDQPESLNVETTQPSLLKKSGLFGKSVAVSGTPSPVGKSSENGDEDVSSQSKNGATDSNTNGDHPDEGVADATNGDADELAHGDDEEMTVDETAEEKEETLEEDAKATEPATADEPEKKETADTIEDIEMADEAEEDDEIQEVEPAKKDDEVIDEEKEEKESPASPEKDETEEEKKEEEVEEVCVKKVISMDTDETEETPAEAKKDDSAADATQYESAEDEEKAADASQDYHTAEEEEEAPVVATPKRGRGRPPKSASSTPAAAKKTPSAKTPKTPAAKTTPAAAAAVEEEAEEAAPSKRTPRGAAKKAAEALASPAPSSTKGRGRRSIKSDTSSQPDMEEKKEEEGDEEKAEEAVEEEAKTPAATRGRRSLKSTPATATRGTPRGKKAEEEEETDEKEEVKEEGEGEEEEAVVVEKTPRRGRRSVQSTPASKKETPARASKSAKKEEEDGEESASVSPSRRSTRGSPTKTPQSTAKGRGRKASVKSEATTVETETEEEKMDGDEEEEEEEVVEKKGRGRGRKSASGKTPTASAKKAGKKAADDEEDPFDMDTELDKHPEPLRNITVEKKEFGECKYTRSPAVSKSKYAATERSASDKVANLPNTPAATGTPKTIASAQSTRKSLGGSPVKRTPSGKRGKKSKEDGEDGETEGEDDDPMEEDGAMETTPARKGRGRPPGSGASTGRKRKAASPHAAASSAKRPTMNVDIPELDAEAQWAADHPEDDSAPLVPGARVFAVFQKVFYPALVGERDGLGRYMVEFIEDKIVRPVPPAGVVPLSAVTIDKECLFQSSADDEPIQCRVLRSANAANAKEWQAGVFKLIEIGNEEAEHEAQWTQLQLDMATSEWKKYVNMMSKKVTKINTDNITSLTDKRERRSRVHNDTAVAIATMTGGTPEPQSRRSVTRKTPAASAASAKSLPKTPGTGRRGRKSKATLAAEAAAAAAETAKEEEEEEGEKKAEEEKMETDEPAAAAEPEVNPRIFLNKMFILTSANRTAGDIVFKKNEMKKQILERGGVVLEDINQVPLDAEAYLISDTHYRTHKYLAAMSRGMPCLSHKWLVECVQREELAPYDEYKLAGGQGLLNGELYPLPDVRGKLLVGRTIMVHSKTDSHMKRGTMGFKQIWSPIVELLGAAVVSDAPLADWTSASSAASLPAFEILLTDSSCPPEIVNKLESAGKAVVSSEWLIQSIIMGSCPDFSAHPRFRYDSGNEPAKKEGSQEQPTSQPSQQS